MKYANRNLLAPSGIELTAVYPRHSLDGDIHIVSTVFDFLQQGVVGVIGPGDSDGVRLVNGILSSMQIPHIAPQATDPYLNSSSKFPYLIRLTPPDDLLNQVLIDVFRKFNWKNCAILTSANNYGTYGEQGLRWFLLHAFKEGWDILALEQHDTPDDPRKLNVTEQLLNIKNSDARIIIMFTVIKYAPFIFREAYDANLLGKGYAWILIDGAGDLDFVYQQSLPQGYPLYLRGLLSIRPISEEGAKFRSFEEQWHLDSVRRQPFDSQFTDAVLLIAEALKDAKLNRMDLTPTTLSPGLDHSQYINQKWKQGNILKDFILNQKLDGLTRYIEFSNVTYIPKNLEFGIYSIQFSNNQRSKVGYWTQDKGLKMTSNITWLGKNTGKLYDLPQTLAGRKYRIVTIHSPPFIIRDEKPDGQKFKGYLVDLLNLLAADLNFEFELYEVEDKNWGNKLMNGQWTGLIQDVMTNKADFAVADLTVTKSREEAVRFSKAYFRAGMALAMQLQQEEKTLFYWLNPLAANVWIAMFGVCVTCALIMCFYSKYSPMSYEVDQEDEITFTFYNCLWFMVASFMQQGPDDGSPRCLSARLIAIVWWITCILIITLYSATLTANLTVNSMKKPINSIYDLTKQDRYTYGTVGNTSYQSMFQNTTYMEYEKVNEKLKFVDNSDTAYRRISEENFIFIWDTPLLDYERRKRDCSFERLSNEFGYSQYASAFPRNNATMEHVAHLFDKAILGYDEKKTLKLTWQAWLDRAGSCSKGSAQSSESNRYISLHDLSGLFLLIGAIILSSFIAFFCENIYYSVKDKKQKKAANIKLAVKNRWQLLMEKAQKERAVKTANATTSPHCSLEEMQSVRQRFAVKLKEAAVEQQRMEELEQQNQLHSHLRNSEKMSILRPDCL